MNTAADNLQDIFNETVEETLAEHQNKDIQDAEEIAYEEMKPNYLSQLISRYKYMVGMTAALKKDQSTGDYWEQLKCFGKKKIMVTISLCSMQ